MSCQVTILDKQNEFEFFQQLKEFPDTFHCCGPKVELGFTRDSMVLTLDAMEYLKLDPNYLDKFEPVVLSAEFISLKMCTKHWFIHAANIDYIARKEQYILWNDLATMIFKSTCETNKWDIKEMFNYASTLSSMLKDNG